MINAIVSLIKVIVIGLLIGFAFGYIGKAIEYAYTIPAINALLH